MCSYKSYLALFASLLVICQSSFSQVIKLTSPVPIRMDELRPIVNHQALSWKKIQNQSQPSLIGPCMVNDVACSSFDGADLLRNPTNITDSSLVNRNPSSILSTWSGRIIASDSTDLIGNNQRVRMLYNIASPGVKIPNSVQDFGYENTATANSAINPGPQLDGSSNLFSLQTWPVNANIGGFSLADGISTPLLRFNTNQTFPLNLIYDDEDEVYLVDSVSSGQRSLGVKVSQTETFAIFNSKSEVNGSGEFTEIRGLTIPTTSGRRTGPAGELKKIYLVNANEMDQNRNRVPYGTHIVNANFLDINKKGYVVALTVSGIIPNSSTNCVNPTSTNCINSKPKAAQILKYSDGWKGSVPDTLSLVSSNNNFIDHASLISETNSIIYSEITPENASTIKLTQLDGLFDWGSSVTKGATQTIRQGFCPVVSGNYLAFVTSDNISSSDVNNANDVYLYSMEGSQFKNPVTGAVGVPYLVSQNPNEGNSFSGSSGIDDTVTGTPRCKLDIETNGNSIVVSYITRSNQLASIATGGDSNSGNIAQNGGIIITTNVQVPPYSGTSGKPSTTRINLNTSFPNATLMPNGRKFPVLMEYVLSNRAVVTSREQFTLTSTGSGTSLQRFLTLGHRMPAATTTMTAYLDGYGPISFPAITTATAYTGYSVAIIGDFNLDGVKNIQDDAIFIEQTGFSQAQSCNSWIAKDVQDNLALDALNVNRDTTGAGSLGVVDGADGLMLGLCSNS